MARCMLCSSAVGATEVVCPHCGGAVEEEPGDVTHVQGIDLTKVDGPPAAETAWPGEGPSAVPEPPPGGWYQPPQPPAGPPPGPWGGGTYPGFTYGPPGGGDGVAPAGGDGPPPGPGYGSSAAPYVPYSAGPWGAGPAWPGYNPAPPSEGLAVASFITSLLGLLLTFSCGIPILACPVGAVLGHLALRRIAENGTRGRGLALAGIIIGWIATALLVLGTATFIAVAVASS
jgi:hypothetical protein